MLKGKKINFLNMFKTLPVFVLSVFISIIIAIFAASLFSILFIINMVYALYLGAIYLFKEKEKVNDFEYQKNSNFNKNKLMDVTDLEMREIKSNDKAEKEI